MRPPTHVLSPNKKDRSEAEKKRQNGQMKIAQMELNDERDRDRRRERTETGGGLENTVGKR